MQRPAGLIGALWRAGAVWRGATGRGAPMLVLAAVAATVSTNLLWFWLVLFVVVGLATAFFRRPASAAPAPPPVDVLGPGAPPGVVAEVMDVRMATEQDGVRIFRGPLRVSAEEAYRRLRSALPAETAPLVQEDDQMGTAVALVPALVSRRRPSRVWLNWLLFVLTLLTTLWAGASYQGVDLLRRPARFAVGLPYAVGLMLILGVHELGHFFAARHHRMDVTPPYFIPVPFALGTFGAFIQMRSAPEGRRPLFDVAVAGPLAGLVVAIPALFVGLRGSHVITSAVASHVTSSGAGTLTSSILFGLIAKLAMGRRLTGSVGIQLSPLAFAGWLGLFITGLNLLPVGQLDGGHMAYAMFGPRTGKIISSVGLWSLFLLAIFVWPGLMVWAIIVFFLAGRHVPPLNDVTPVTPGQKLLGFITFFILVLILTPMPAAVWQELTRFPYL